MNSTLCQKKHQNPHFQLFFFKIIILSALILISAIAENSTEPLVATTKVKKTPANKTADLDAQTTDDVVLTEFHPGRQRQQQKVNSGASTQYNIGQSQCKPKSKVTIKAVDQRTGKVIDEATLQQLLQTQQFHSVVSQIAGSSSGATPVSATSPVSAVNPPESSRTQMGTRSQTARRKQNLSHQTTTYLNTTQEHTPVTGLGNNHSVQTHIYPGQSSVIINVKPRQVQNQSAPLQQSGLSPQQAISHSTTRQRLSSFRQMIQDYVSTGAPSQATGAPGQAMGAPSQATGAPSQRNRTSHEGSKDAEIPDVINIVPIDSDLNIQYDFQPQN